MANGDWVRKSSGWIDEVVNADTVWAADLMARSDAVKLDLKDSSRGNGRDDRDGGWEEIVSANPGFVSESAGSVSRRG